MKVADYEVWAKDGHVHLQMSQKQFDQQKGVVKLSVANTKQLLMMATDMKAVSAQELLRAAMKLTTKRLDLVLAIADKFDMETEELCSLLDNLAVSSDCPEAAVVEMFLEVTCDEQ